MVPTEISKNSRIFMTYRYCVLDVVVVLEALFEGNEGCCINECE